jgi:biotin-(acetyl-CoA carboxylase) ligase
MTETPWFPPVYRPLAIEHGDALDRACAQAAAGAGAGTLVWSRRADRLDCAVVLEPDRPLGAALLVVPVAALALADALGAVGPPTLPITVGWPGRVLVDGAVVGEVRLADFGNDLGAVPDRLVLGAAVDVLGDPDDDAPGRHPERSDLREEGFDDITVPELAESFSRHLLLGMTRWIEDGFDPVRAALLNRLTPDPGPPVRGIADDGTLLFGDGSALPLPEALAAHALEDAPWR